MGPKSMPEFPVTAVGYSIVSPKTLRPRKYRKLCAAAGTDPTELLIAGREAGALDELDVRFSKFPITRPAGRTTGKRPVSSERSRTESEIPRQVDQTTNGPVVSLPFGP